MTTLPCPAKPAHPWNSDPLATLERGLAEYARLDATAAIAVAAWFAGAWRDRPPLPPQGAPRT